MIRSSAARTTAVAGLASVALLVGAVPALAGSTPTNPATPPTFTRINVDTNLPGASFSSQGDVYGDTRPELVVSSYDNLVVTPSGTRVPAPAGRLQVYTNGADLTQWTKHQVFDESAQIMFPNDVKVADVSGDGKADLIVPGGYFFDNLNPDLPPNATTNPPMNRGSLTWWENKGVGQPWVRHNIEANSPWAYHGVQYVDIDGDAIPDVVTSAEQGNVASDNTDDLEKTRYFKGVVDGVTGARTFLPAIDLSNNGGSSPQVADVDQDGNLDIVTAQFFGESSTAPTYVWMERVGNPDAVTGKLSPANFVSHLMIPQAGVGGRGPGFQMKLVPNLRGDGVNRWVGTNHLLYPTSILDPSAPRGGLFEIIPGSNVTAPWTSSMIAGPFEPRTQHDEGRAAFGQGAPGVLGYGDVDGDGDTDFALSGDGDYRVFWIEQKGNGQFETHVLADHVGPPLSTDPSKRGFGQSGGALIMDLDNDGKNEIEFSSFDENMVAIWTRTAPTSVTSSLSLTGGGVTKVGTARTLTATLNGVAGTGTRTAKVTFKPNRTGIATTVATATLAPTGTPGQFRGTVSVKPGESGAYAASYAGTTINPLLLDTPSTAAATGVTVSSTVTGFPTKSLVIKKYKSKKTAAKKAKLSHTVTVTPGFGRTVVLQKRTCAPTKKSCTWKTAATGKVAGNNKVTLKATAPKKVSYWRVTSVATKSGTAVTSPVRKVTRK